MSDVSNYLIGMQLAVLDDDHDERVLAAELMTDMMNPNEQNQCLIDQLNWDGNQWDRQWAGDWISGILE